MPRQLNCTLTILKICRKKIRYIWKRSFNLKIKAGFLILSEFEKFQTFIPVQRHAHYPGIDKQQQDSLLISDFSMSEVPTSLPDQFLLVLNPSDMFIRQSFETISTLYSFSRRYFRTSNCSTPTTPTMISSIPRIKLLKNLNCTFLCDLIDALDELLSSYPPPDGLWQNARAQMSEFLLKQTVCPGAAYTVSLIEKIPGSNTPMIFPCIPPPSHHHMAVLSHHLLEEAETDASSCLPEHDRLPQMLQTSGADWRKRDPVTVRLIHILPVF